MQSRASQAFRELHVQALQATRLFMSRGQRECQFCAACAADCVNTKSALVCVGCFFEHIVSLCYTARSLSPFFVHNGQTLGLLRSDIHSFVTYFQQPD